MAPVFWPLTSFRSIVVGKAPKVVEKEQAFAVVRLRAGRLVKIVGNEVIHCRDSRCVWMPERNALDGCEARKGQEITERIHPDILVEQYVELLCLDEPSG